MPKTLNLRDQRFRTLWTLLRWEGAFRNSQVQALFGLSSGQASRLIAEFRTKFPRKIEMEPRTKSWVPIEITDAESRGGEMDEYIVIQTRLLGESPVWYQDSRPDFVAPSADKFRVIRQACDLGAGVSMKYSSLTQGPRERVIYPHAIVQLPQRWHVRAWCVMRSEYRDFNFGRMSELQLISDARPDMPGDTSWNQFVSLRVKPHRNLNAVQFDTVQLELCGGAMARRISVRGALVPYVLNDLRIASEPTRQKPPEYLLELMNKDVEKFLFNKGAPDELTA